MELIEEALPPPTLETSRATRTASLGKFTALVPMSVGGRYRGPLLSTF